MARFDANTVDNYGGQGNGGFFSIANDKQVKKVRFMYNKVEDIEGYAVHKVEVNGKERYVNCLREYNQSADVCPFCREGKPVQARLFIPLYNIAEKSVQLWDRGKTMFSKITSLCSRYATRKNLVNNIFDVERNGKPKDQKTTYEMYQIEADDTELSDLPEVPKILGGFVLDKSADDMEYYLESGEFPPTDGDERPARRNEQRDEVPIRRRTPATSQNNEDVY